jgi:hypothetical protein
MRTGESYTRVPARTTRVSGYVLPLAAIPTVLAGAGVPAEAVTPVRAVVRAHAPAASAFGRALDRRLAYAQADLAAVLDRLDVPAESVVISRMPKRVENRRMRVVRHERRLAIADPSDELDALLAANER